MTKTHLPKHHNTLLGSETVENIRVEDDTKYRIMGDTNHALPKTENYQYAWIHSVMARV